MKKIHFAVFLLFSALPVFAQPNVKMYNLEGGIALEGYDPVGYFTLGKAVKGRKEFSYFYDGVTYYFASGLDRENFRLSPVQYMPQYGGWCAYAMGHDGTKVEVDPKTFKIMSGKLYLFYNRFFNNTLNSWNQDETKLHAQADANWQKIIHP
jgi:YHS domain-containing protein